MPSLDPSDMSISALFPVLKRRMSTHNHIADNQNQILEKARNSNHSVIRSHDYIESENAFLHNEEFTSS